MPLRRAMADTDVGYGKASDTDRGHGSPLMVRPALMACGARLLRARRVKNF
jgi:hypothetical protein